MTTQDNSPVLMSLPELLVSHNVVTQLALLPCTKEVLGLRLGCPDPVCVHVLPIGFLWVIRFPPTVQMHVGTRAHLQKRCQCDYIGSIKVK